MRRPLLNWIAFGLCLLVGLSAMGWISLQVIRLDRSEEQAHQQAEFEESVRLALWQMDSAMTNVIAQESSRPFLFYNLYPASGKGVKGGKVADPPLVTDVVLNGRLNFQLDPQGNITSPQASAEIASKIKEGRLFSARLEEFRSLVRKEELLEAVSQEEEGQILAGEVQQPKQQEDPQGSQRGDSLQGQDQQPETQIGTQRNQVTQMAQPPPQQLDNNQLVQQAQIPRQIQRRTTRSSQRQAFLNSIDWNARSGNVSLANDLEQQKLLRAFFPETDARPGAMKPVWIGDALILARKVLVDGEDYIQGLWLDWPRLKEWLLSRARDLFPQADLQKIDAVQGARNSRRLAALPAVLIPGSSAFPPPEGWSPLLISLCIAWICVLAGAVVGAFLLKGILALSERRAAFVSAVTHELRTPLTTFKMYTEMLARGMVSEPEKKSAYLTTLSREAERLSHLVQNVLAYARLERNRNGGRVETISIGELLERVTGRLEERADQAGMKLNVDVPDEVLAARVRVDSSAVDQILFNLVDNSTKYAGKSGDAKIHLCAESSGRFAVLSIRDHGPGISSREAQRLFQPFSKSARDAANSAPGVGLGLALSRRLARAMGGKLELDENTHDGARFVLRLPLA